MGETTFLLHLSIQCVAVVNVQTVELHVYCYETHAPRFDDFKDLASTDPVYMFKLVLVLLFQSLTHVKFLRFITLTCSPVSLKYKGELAQVVERSLSM